MCDLLVTVGFTFIMSINWTVSVASLALGRVSDSCLTVDVKMSGALT